MESNKADKHQNSDNNQAQDRECFVGELLEGKAHDYRIHNSNNGSRNEGYYKDNLVDGRGMQTNPDGSSYKGYLKERMKRGFGIEINSDGNVYEGQYFNNKKHGKG
jgi:hypothetical protein